MLFIYLSICSCNFFNWNEIEWGAWYISSVQLRRIGNFEIKFGLTFHVSNQAPLEEIFGNSDILKDLQDYCWFVWSSSFDFQLYSEAVSLEGGFCGLFLLDALVFFNLFSMKVLDFIKRTKKKKKREIKTKLVFCLLPHFWGHLATRRCGWF